MSPQSKTERRLKLIYILWGLLFTKCFVLEYLVRKYQAPINSLAYVWSLSIIMATVATIVYGRLEDSDDNWAASGRALAPYFAAKAFAAILILWALIGSPENSHLALAVAAPFIGASQVLDPPLKPITFRTPLLIAWIVAAALLFLVGPPNVFLIFGAGILVLSVVPRSYDLFTNR